LERLSARDSQWRHWARLVCAAPLSDAEPRRWEHGAACPEDDAMGDLKELLKTHGMLNFSWETNKALATSCVKSFMPRSMGVCLM